MKRHKISIVTFFLVILSGLLTTQVNAKPFEPPRQVIQTGSAGIATGDPNGEHTDNYDWPFPFQQMGHLNSSYQLYSDNLNNAYFHHGIDMIAADGTPVHTPCAGQVVNIENYSYGSPYYWEVAILDQEGYVWQYHHIAQGSIPTVIYQAFTSYQADPASGGFVSANSHIGDIVWWPEVSFGYRFNHIHLNILAAGDIYLNPLEFLNNTYTDTQPPQIQEVGLFTGINQLLTGNTIPYGSDYSLYIKTRDLFMSQVFYLPPHRITYRLDGNDQANIVWDFHNLPGGSSESAFVNQYFLPGLTRGNYDERVFYIDLGFDKDGANPLPTEPGPHSIEIEVWDYAYNRATWKYNWIITQSLVDDGCASGQGLTYTHEVTEPGWVKGISVGLVMAHEARGELKLSLQGPQDNSPTILIAPSADGNLNYNILIDDASSAPINNNRRDDLTPPYFKRAVGPLFDGSLDAYLDTNAIGTWEIFVCDSKPGNTGSLYALDLQLELTANQRPVSQDLTVTGSAGKPLQIVLLASDPDGDELEYAVTAPEHGRLEGIAPNLVYIPNLGFVGTDQFTFTVNDGELTSAPATVTIAIYAEIWLPLVAHP